MSPLLVAVACSAGVSAPPPWDPSLPETWLPEGTTQVLRGRAETLPLLLTMAEVGEPCVPDLMREFDAAWQFQRDPKGGVFVVVFGTGTRDDVEACVRKVGEHVDDASARLGISSVRDGVLTTFEAPSGARQIAAFLPGRVAWANNREAMERLLRGPRLAPSDPLVQLLPLLRDDAPDTVTSIDYTGALTGVRSLGAVVHVDKSTEGVTGGATIVFATPDDADSFMAEVDRVAAAPDADPRMRTVVSLLRARRDGANVEVDLVAVMKAMETHPEIGPWIQEVGAQTVEAAAR